MRSLSAREIFDKLGYNPIADLVKIRLTSDDAQIQAQCAKELAKYFIPQLKAVEMSGGLDLDHGALSQEISKILADTKPQNKDKKDV